MPCLTSVLREFLAWISRAWVATQRPDGGLTLDRAIGVKDTALDPGGRPGGLHSAGDALPTIAHDNIWGHDPRHQCFPGAGGLTLGHVPAKHMGLGAGNKNHQLVGQVDSVNKDHMVNLFNQWRNWP